MLKTMLFSSPAVLFPQESMTAPSLYSPLVQQLIAAAPPCELGAGKPNEALRATLRTLKPETLSDAGAPRDRDMAACCVSGLWLLHNFLDESHSLSQDIGSSSGSFWHGIMHRREGDFANAKYWFRRVGEHPVFPDLNDAARDAAAERLAVGDRSPLAESLASQLAWNSCRFVDLCETAGREKGGAFELCRQIATAEWKLLFEYCHRQAFGA